MQEKTHTGKYDAVLFDLDGTLTDSGPGIMKSAVYAYTKLGIDVPSQEVLRTFVGPPLSVAFSRNGVSADRVEEAIRLYRKYYADRGKFENEPYPGIASLLDALLADGMRLFVATSKPEALSVEILEHFDLARRFEIIAGATFDHSRENKEDVISYLFDRTGTAQSAVLVGDTEFDANGARSAGIDFIGVSWGYGDIGHMIRSGAKAIADTPEKLYDLLHG